MRTILYTQGEKPTDNDKIIIDGHLEEYLGTVEQKKELDYLLASKKFPIVNLKPIPDNLSKNLECHYKKGKGFFIRGLYNNLVKSGSRNYYTYFAETDDIEEAISYLKSISSKSLNYDCDDNDLNWIKQKFQESFLNGFINLEISKSIKYIVLILIIVIVIWIIIEWVR